MTKRAFGQYCGVARALEVVGERWALLIIRDLLVGPKRYTDLRAGLPRIPTNVLATRLKELEEAGLVVRRVQPRPSGSIVYELTPYGAQLEGVVLELGRWGARSLGEFRDGEIATAETLIMALRSTFQPAAAEGVRTSYELRFGEVVINAEVEDGSLATGIGPLPAADLVIEATAPLTPLLAGEASVDEVLADGTVLISGEQAGLDRFAALFRITPRPR